MTVRDTSDMGTQSGCKCLFELLFPSSSSRYAGSSNRRFAPKSSKRVQTGEALPFVIRALHSNFTAAPLFDCATL